MEGDVADAAPTPPATFLAGALQDHARENPPMGWIARLTLQSFQAGLASFTTQPSERDLIKFATGTMGDRLKQLLRQLTGNTCRFQITVAAPDAPDTADETPATLTRQAAMDLPMVKEVMGCFSATIVDIHPEKVRTQTPNDPSPPAPVLDLPQPLPDDLSEMEE